MKRKTLLVVAHAPSPNTQKILAALERGYQYSESSDINFFIKHPSDTSSADVLTANAIIIFTPENLSYMSGLTKDFFDRIYYSCLEHTQGKPCTAIIRAGQGGGDGTLQALNTITTGLRWRWVQSALVLRGDWQDSFLTKSEELAAAIAVALEAGMI